MPAWVHTVQNLLCSHTVSMDVDKVSDQSVDGLSISAWVHTVQSLLCSHTVSMDVDKVSDKIVDACLCLHGCALFNAFSAPIQ